MSALERMSLIVPPINQLDAVLVMAKDQKLRSNRLGMLKALHSVLSLVVDLSKIVFASASGEGGCGSAGSELAAADLTGFDGFREALEASSVSE